VKLVTAVIRPHRWEAVRSAVEMVGISGMTVSEVTGRGRQQGPSEVHGGAEYDITLVPKLRIEIVATDDEIPEIVDKIVTNARTGKIGDGKVWVVPVAAMVRVRTDDLDEVARVPSAGSSAG